jgi:hypothetical protein
MPPSYKITVTSGNNTLLETSKTRYDHEATLVAELAQKLLDPVVQNIAFNKTALTLPQETP